MADLRVCFVGESFVAGTGDPEHRGWVGRIAAMTEEAGRSLSTYNLGIRRETSEGLRSRWAHECRPRLPAGTDGRVVVSTGVNDTSLEDGVPRVPPASSVAHWRAVLDGVRAAGWPVLAVGPPPTADADHVERIVALDAELSAVCAALDVPYVGVVGALRDDEVWRREVRDGDGSHPSASGYGRMANLIWPAWRAWLDGPPAHPKFTRMS